MARILRHLIHGERQLKAVLPDALLQEIEQEIATLEKATSGEIVFAIDHSLSIVEVLRKCTARERAIQKFSSLRIWDTEHNNGALLYLLLADREIEIVVDRGIARLVPATRWQEICTGIEQHLRSGNFREGILGGLREIGAELARCFPPDGSSRNELPNRPAV